VKVKGFFKCEPCQVMWTRETTEPRNTASDCWNCGTKTEQYHWHTVYEEPETQQHVTPWHHRLAEGMYDTA
jgi:hypothetical protein